VLYARIGGAEGIAPEKLGDIDMRQVAASFADAYPRVRFPAVMMGSSNGAMTNLAASMQIPWLPATLLVPVHRVGPANRPDLALQFGREHGPALLDANPDIVLHQMHDSAQDEVMVARMTYFRTKWMTLPAAYAEFLSSRLEPGAPVILINDESTWPVTRVSARHVFQSGGRGGVKPEQYLAMPHTPEATDEAPEAEWGAGPGFTTAVREWCSQNGHPVVEIRIDGPQEASHPVAQIIREWITDRGGDADELIVPSFVLGDPWRTIELGRVPFWTFFPVDPALESLRYHLAHSHPYRAVDLFLFQHGALSPGLASPKDFEAVVTAARAEPRVLALRKNKSPRDIGAMGRYGSALRRERSQPLPFTPLSLAEMVDGLQRHPSERGRIILHDPATREAQGVDGSRRDG
jgi:hypothetical protein